MKDAFRNGVTAFALLASGHAFATPLPTEPGTNGGLYVAENPIFQVLQLRSHPEALGLNNLEAQGAFDPSPTSHYQGLARHPGPTNDPVFYITANNKDGGGFLGVFRFGTRDGDGERLRSNVQSPSQDTEDVQPNSSDSYVRGFRFDGQLAVGGDLIPAYKHPGGPAIIDGYMLVPVDTPVNENDTTGMIVVFDVSDPLNPEPVSYFPLNHKIDNIAVTRYPASSPDALVPWSSRYVIWANGDGGNGVKMYVASLEGLATASFSQYNKWQSSFVNSIADWPTGTGAHQSSTFVRDPSGDLFMVGTRHPGGLPGAGTDYVDVYRVNGVSGAPIGQVSLELIFSRTLNCVVDGGGGLVDMRLCNFAAGGHTYVSPSGEIIIYAIPHDDQDGPVIDYARLAEFRHVDVLRPNNPLLSSEPQAGGPYTVTEGGFVQLNGVIPDPSQAWFVELYDDDGFRDRSIMVDYEDRTRFELNNFNNLDNFNDKASSVRWRLPFGVNVFLYEDDSSAGDPFLLVGNGQVQGYTDLGDLGFGDKTSSMAFLGSPAGTTPTGNWDLDGDTTFGETGVAASNGDESGNQATFDAANLDGPVTQAVALRYSPSIGDPATSSTTVSVLNAPPGVSIEARVISTVESGGTVMLDVLTEDAGAVDGHLLSIDWGDGNIGQLDLGTNRSDTVQHDYARTAPPEPVIAVQVDDGDDQDETSTTARIGAPIYASLPEPDQTVHVTPPGVRLLRSQGQSRASLVIENTAIDTDNRDLGLLSCGLDGPPQLLATAPSPVIAPGDTSVVEFTCDTGTAGSFRGTYRCSYDEYEDGKEDGAASYPVSCQVRDPLSRLESSVRPGGQLDLELV
ncbi:MAG: hypothetical protein AAGH19_08430, partial [Pseudomonadota bacterium]